MIFLTTTRLWEDFSAIRSISSFFVIVCIGGLSASYLETPDHQRPCWQNSEYPKPFELSVFAGQRCGHLAARKRVRVTVRSEAPVEHSQVILPQWFSSIKRVFQRQIREFLAGRVFNKLFGYRAYRFEGGGNRSWGGRSDLNLVK